MLWAITVAGASVSLTRAFTNIQEIPGGLLMNNTLAKAEFGHPRQVKV